MRLRFGLLIGGALGYLFGTRAGRERYEQLRSTYESVRNSEKVNTLTDKARSASESGLENIKEKAKAATADGTPIANAVDKAKSKSEELVEKAKDAKDTVVTKAQDTKDTVVAKTHDAKDAVADKTQTAKDKLSN